MIAKRELKDKKVYYQSFIGHTLDALKILKCYLEIKADILDGFCKRWDLNPQVLIKDLFLMIAFHDIGKMTVEFQQNITDGKHSPDYPHSFWALPIISQFPFSEEYDKPYPVLAILGHHTQLHREIYECLEKKVTFCKAEIEKFISQDIKECYQIIGFNDFFTLPEIFADLPTPERPRKISEKYIEPLRRDYKDTRIKSIYTFFLSVLKLCDDYSSAAFSDFISTYTGVIQTLDNTLNSPGEYVIRLPYSKTYFKEVIFQRNQPYSFQKELSDRRQSYSFLFAPCGRGKTEAALSWAAEIMETQKRDRIVFALPTQVTCNAMYDRFIDKEKGYGLDEKYVGLFHGKSYLALEEKADKDDEEDNGKCIRDENFKGNVFIKPITISTIDHLAYSLVHGFSQADFACGNLQSSIVIFDEIHYYETHTLNNLLVVFQKLREMKIPHLLMTGTAPQFLLNALNSEYSIIWDDEGLAYQPFTILGHSNKYILKNNVVLESIIEDYLAQKKIFVILNQVPWTQSFFDDLNGEMNIRGIKPNIYLYHGRFTYKDRIKKETEIKKAASIKAPCIIIATQVIEISLNISCDVMYSQIAPPDALGQRAGRLNRSGKYYKNGFQYELKIFNVEKYKPYVELIIQKLRDLLRDGPCSYLDIKNYCDEVYKEVKLIPCSNYFDYFKRNTLFGDSPKDVTWGDDDGRGLKIRESNYQTINVVPYEFKEFIDNGNDLNRFKMQIPYYIYLKNKEYFWLDERGKKEPIIYCHFPYSYEKGLEIKINLEFDDAVC